MNSKLSLRPSEQTEFLLRSLFDSYGYSNYKMNKFEEYDIYARNKDFLVSEEVITFTDTNGKLMALKPDVTLSIVKNTKDEDNKVNKLYYNENVYRVSKGTRSFKEIMQVGLECIGDVDEYCISEVLLLAKKSLELVGRESVLDVSDLSIVNELMDYSGIPEERKSAVIRLIGEKNVHELVNMLDLLGIEKDRINDIRRLVLLHGKADNVIPELERLVENKVNSETLAQFIRVMSAFGNSVNIDFSVVGDINYYNGFVFKGFIEGIPNFVLSGGQYDMLMKKMKRQSGAIGFAVYLDMIEQLLQSNEEYDVDTVLLYGNDTPLDRIISERERYIKDGNTVLVSKNVPENIKFRSLVRID